MAVMGILNLQCSWTPEVETVLYDGPHGLISLGTTHAIKITPNHPARIPEFLITNILSGITKSQDVGMLQQLLLTAPPTVPAFSPSQIKFLAPHLSLALSKATKEEIIHFRSPAIDEQSYPVQGTVAVFPQTNLLLTLNNTTEKPLIPSKGSNASRDLQIRHSLGFSRNENLKKVEQAEAFMSIPPTSLAIVIDYQLLEPLNQLHHEPQPSNQRPSIINERRGTTPREMDSLHEQLRDLQKKIDEQSEEIRRLKQTRSP